MNRRAAVCLFSAFLLFSSFAVCPTTAQAQATSYPVELYLHIHAQDNLVDDWWMNGKMLDGFLGRMTTVGGSAEVVYDLKPELTDDLIIDTSEEIII